METENTLSEDLLLCQKKRKAVQAIAQLMAEWDASLDQEESALRTLNQVASNAETFEQRFREAQLTLPCMGLPKTVRPVFQISSRRANLRGNKPEVQVIEEIFRLHGPLHVTDLVRVGQPKGILFKGSKRPTLMARDKMYSSKRFHNFGNNVWGLPDQEVPERYKKHISGKKASGITSHGEVQQDDIQIVA